MQILHAKVHVLFNLKKIMKQGTINVMLIKSLATFY